MREDRKLEVWVIQYVTAQDKQLEVWVIQYVTARRQTTRSLGNTVCHCARQTTRSLGNTVCHCARQTTISLGNTVCHCARQTTRSLGNTVCNCERQNTRSLECCPLPYDGRQSALHEARPRARTAGTIPVISVLRSASVLSQRCHSSLSHRLAAASLTGPLSSFDLLIQ